MSDAAKTENVSLSVAEQEAERICRDLIRIDTSNYGDGSGPGERAAAEYVMEQLTEVGLDPVLHESQKGRANVVVRLEGRDADRGALVLHGHLDVVPANAADWSVDPFAAEVKDDCIWGRGAVDMKDMDAMILANVRELARSGRKPARDTIVTFFADEEAGGVHGSHYMVDHHRDLFEGATEAISEVGGFSVTLPGKGGEDVRAYLLQTAEKGLAWLRLTAHGRAGHGSVPNDDNAIVHLAGAIERISAHTWPRTYIASVRELLDGVADITGKTWSGEDPFELIDMIGGAKGFVLGTLQDTSNFTMLCGGYKDNVIPQTATASLDCRFLPGHEDELMATIRALAGPDVEVSVHHRDTALETGFEGALVDKMSAALLAEDPGSVVLPYCLSGGTDNKALSELGITGYGFAPLRLPKDLDFVGMFHGIDERIPLDSLRFGTRVMGRLLDDC